LNAVVSCWRWSATPNARKAPLFERISGVPFLPWDVVQ